MARRLCRFDCRLAGVSFSDGSLSVSEGNSAKLQVRLPRPSTSRFESGVLSTDLRTRVWKSQEVFVGSFCVLPLGLKGTGSMGVDHCEDQDGFQRRGAVF